MKTLCLLCLALLMNVVQYLLIVQIVYLVQKYIILSIFVDNCYLLDCNKLKHLQQILIVVHLLHLYLDQHLFFVLPNSFIVSGDNSNLYPVFILKTILFLILLGWICTGGFSVKVSCFLIINWKQSRISAIE